MTQTKSQAVSEQSELQAEKRSIISGAQKRQALAFGRALLFLAPSLILFFTFVFIPLIRSFELSAYLTDLIGRPAKFVGLMKKERGFTLNSCAARCTICGPVSVTPSTSSVYFFK